MGYGNRRRERDERGSGEWLTALERELPGACLAQRLPLSEQRHQGRVVIAA